MSKGFCYKTLENYNVPRDQLKSFCKYGSKAGYYNISNSRGICNDGQCRAKENFQPIPSTAWQQPAAVRGTWNQVKGLYELNPQSNSCVSWNGRNQEGYDTRPRAPQQHNALPRGRGPLAQLSVSDSSTGPPHSRLGGQSSVGGAPNTCDAKNPVLGLCGNVMGLPPGSPGACVPCVDGCVCFMPGRGVFPHPDGPHPQYCSFGDSVGMCMAKDPNVASPEMRI